MDSEKKAEVFLFLIVHCVLLAADYVNSFYMQLLWRAAYSQILIKQLALCDRLGHFSMDYGLVMSYSGAVHFWSQYTAILAVELAAYVTDYN